MKQRETDLTSHHVWSPYNLTHFSLHTELTDKQKPLSQFLSPCSVGAVSVPPVVTFSLQPFPIDLVWTTCTLIMDLLLYSSPQSLFLLPVCHTYSYLIVCTDCCFLFVSLLINLYVVRHTWFVCTLIICMLTVCTWFVVHELFHRLTTLDLALSF